MFKFLSQIFRPTVVIDAGALPVVNSAEPPRQQRTRPAHLQFDETEPSEFGTQVAMLLALQPDAWRIHDSLRLFSHPELGLFEFDDNDRLQHMGTDVRTSPYETSVAGKQRALTLGDHHAISEALRALLLSPVTIGQRVEGDATSAIYRGERRPTGTKGDLWYDARNRLHRHDGTGWVEQAPAALNAATAMQASQSALMQKMQQLQNQHTQLLIDQSSYNQIGNMLAHSRPRPPMVDPAISPVPHSGGGIVKNPGA